MNSKNNTTFTLPAADLKWIIDGVLVAASRRDDAPIITAVHWKVTPDEVRLIATDRYRIHTATLPLRDSPIPAEFTAPLALMVWAQRNARAFVREWGVKELASVRVTFSPDSKIVAFDVLTPKPDVSLRMSADAVPGRYPDVMSILDAAREAPAFAAPVGLNPKFVGDVGKLAKYPGQAPKMTLTAGTGVSGKPGPALFTYSALDHGESAEALIQPHYIPTTD